MRSFLTAAGLGASLVVAACSGSGYGGGGNLYGNPGPGSGPQNCATSPLSGAPIIVTVGLGVSACNDTTAGMIRGFDHSGTMAQVVVLTKSQTIKFHNSEATMHSADSLGTFTDQGSWPGSYSGAPAASVAGTAITSAGFSTGALAANSDSAVYNTGTVSGMVMIGCRFHYNSSTMRTLVIVQ